MGCAGPGSGWISDFERMAALHWQAAEQAALGGWVLRASGGFTGRANSALPLGDPGTPLAGAVAAVEEWYRARGLPPMIQLPMMLGGGADACPLDELLAGRGWRVRPGPAVVMTGRSAAVARHAGDAGIALAPEPDAQWLARYRYRGAELPPVARSLLLSAPDQVFASVRRGGETVAIGRLSLTGLRRPRARSAACGATGLERAAVSAGPWRPAQARGHGCGAGDGK